jgi:hypothetical protein
VFPKLNSTNRSFLDAKKLADEKAKADADKKGAFLYVITVFSLV